MLFNSLQFLIFFPIVVVLYFCLPYRMRITMLLAASLYFYMCWKAPYVLVIIALILIDYSAGLQIAGSKTQSRKRAFLFLSLGANLSILFFFKYFNFFNDTLASLLKPAGIHYGLNSVRILLPVGVSFHTFQAMSYTIDLYRGKFQPERKWGIFALFVAYFPQLVAGPIERGDRLLPQFHQEHQLDYRMATDGLKLMVWGFFKKLVIADRLSSFVSPVYAHPTRYEGFPLWLATFFFAIQIYCDFSGYSDIAIGGAQVIGIRLMDNFWRPYFSKSVSEFWRRWHISLSSWFRDYVYIPLGGSHVSRGRWYGNLMITFLLSGLWHGANWTYVVWGGLNGLYLVCEVWTESFRRRCVRAIRLERLPVTYKLLRVGITFSLISFAWIFFRSNSLSDAGYIVTHLFHGWGTFCRHLNNERFVRSNILLGQRQWEFGVALFSILFLMTVHMIQRHGSIRHMLAQKPAYIRWTVYYAMIFSILFMGCYQSADFIYFQF